MPQFVMAGAEVMCENLAYELIDRGHNVTVVSLYNYHSPITERMEQNNVRLIYLNKKEGISLGIIRQLRDIIKEYKPDIIHTHLYILKYVAIASVGLGKIGIVHTVHNIAEKENGHIDRVINKFLFNIGKAVPVALSELIKETIENAYGLPKAKIPVILNGVPLPTEVPDRDFSYNETITIINIGRYTEAKNQTSLIKAVINLHKKDNRIQLDIYGDGPLKASINSLIKENHADSYIHENGLTDNVKSKLQTADIFVLPSIYEGIPMTIIEAMGAKMPIIASNVGGIPDMITDGIDGLICGTDSESIESTINTVINDENLRSTISKNAFTKAEVFSSAKMAEHYEHLYNWIIGEKYKSGPI